jgi:hypothetical protein
MRSPLSRLFESSRTHAHLLRRWPVALLLAGTCTTVVVAGAIEAPWAAASPTGVGLGKATPFAVLGASEVTNTGASVISGDLGVSPTTSVTGTPEVVDGSIYGATAVAATAQAALGTAYTDAAKRTPTTLADFSTTALGGKSLVPGIYNATSTMQLTGTLTLNGNGDPNSVFVFQAGSSLITASDSTVMLIGGAQACNVFWQVGSSATLGSTSSFVGSILALTSVTLTTNVTVTGRVLARHAAVTLIDDTVTRPSTCVTATSTTPAAPTISTVAPPSGPTSGGTTVVITGTGFAGVTGATGVKFGTTPATTYTVKSTTEITARSPAGSGVVTITVTAGGKKGTKTGVFTYLASTTTTTTAPAAGGTTATTVPGGVTTTTSPTGTFSTTPPNAGTVVPLGAPETGLGGATRSGPNDLLLATGVLAFAGAAASLVFAIRRRRPRVER